MALRQYLRHILMSPDDDATFAAAMLIAPRLNALPSPWMEFASTSRACKISASCIVPYRIVSAAFHVSREGRRERGRRGELCIGHWAWGSRVEGHARKEVGGDLNWFRARDMQLVGPFSRQNTVYKTRILRNTMTGVGGTRVWVSWRNMINERCRLVVDHGRRTR